MEAMAFTGLLDTVWNLILANPGVMGAYISINPLYGMGAACCSVAGSFTLFATVVVIPSGFGCATEPSTVQGAFVPSSFLKSVVTNFQSPFARL